MTSFSQLNKQTKKQTKKTHQQNHIYIYICTERKYTDEDDGKQHFHAP